MGEINLTVRGNGASTRMVTERTLDREGFYIPTPPQRCDRRIKSAVGLRRQESGSPDFKKNHRPMQRPKSACYATVPADTEHKKQKYQEYQSTANSEEIENVNDFTNLIKTQKMSVNQKWVYKGDAPKWKPRNSQAPERHPLQSGSTIKQRISVCEVMAKMRSKSPDSYDGAAAPPSSPKGRESKGREKSAVVGKRFVDERPCSPNQPGSYMKYAKSKSRTRTEQQPRTSFAYLQEDMTIKHEPSANPTEKEAVQIPTGTDMFCTDEPDEESSAVVDSPATRKRPKAGYTAPRNTPAPSSRPQSNARRTKTPQSEIYKSVYLKDYQDREPIPPTKLYRPKCENVRYTPDSYRFKDRRYTTNTPSHDWDRHQPRLAAHSVSTRRPSHSIYVGVS